MAVSGTLDVNLDNYSTMTNDAARFGAGITTGLADQGSLIGTVLGIIMAVGALLVLIGVIFGVILFVIAKGKGTTSAVRGMK